MPKVGVVYFSDYHSDGAEVAGPTLCEVCAAPIRNAPFLMCVYTAADVKFAHVACAEVSAVKEGVSDGD
jgi:hypothetical protein